MSLLMQISDTHFGTEQPAVVTALLDLARRMKPAVVVLSGDITQRARRAQFRAAGRFAAQLQAPCVLTIPGNHDIPLFNVMARTLQPYANYQREFGSDLEPQFESESLLVVGVNTTRPSRHKDGEVSIEQIERVAQRIRQARAEQLRVVVTHQPVHVVRDADIHNILHGHDAAVRAWSAAGVDLIMGGHIHLPYVHELSAQGSGLPRKIWAVQAGTAVSSRIRDNIPNSVNLIRHDRNDATCRIERWDYDPVCAGFLCVQAHLLQLDRRAGA